MNTCLICGKTGYAENTKKFPKNYCSYRCYEKWLKSNSSPNCKCTICGMSMYIKQSRLKKTKHGVTCSKECSLKLKSLYMSGELNHQYGLVGANNASFKSNFILSNFGYVLEYAPNHPFPHDRSHKTTRVFQHRLNVERNFKMFDSKYFVDIDGIKYLKPEFKVHHKDENKTNNDISNLEIVTMSEHSKIHSVSNKLVRDKLGRIIGVVKLGNIGEP